MTDAVVSVTPEGEVKGRSLFQLAVMRFRRNRPAMAGSVTKVLPPITPARPARPVPAPKTSMNTRGTLWPSASAISGCVSAA